MMGIERRAARARGALPTAGARGPIEGKAGGGFAGELAARIVLGDEFHVAVFEASVGAFKLDTQVRKFEMPVDDRQARGGGKRLNLVAAIAVLCAIGAIQKALILA